VCLLPQTLAYQSDMFSRAQALRRVGCAPAAMGVPDDLPTRMAYEQLHVLAGMAGKVSSGCVGGVVVVCPTPVAGAAASKAGGVLRARAVCVSASSV
jgi:hypothetical protein